MKKVFLIHDWRLNSNNKKLNELIQRAISV